MSEIIAHPIDEGTQLSQLQSGNTFRCNHSNKEQEYMVIEIFGIQGFTFERDNPATIATINLESGRLCLIDDNIKVICTTAKIETWPVQEKKDESK